MTMARVPVCIFAKPPRPGAVKTRLAAQVGARRAADLARAFLADTRAGLEAIEWVQPVVASTEPVPPEWGQGDGDLGARIDRVLARGIAGAGVAIAIGADSPGLPRRLLEAARRSLDGADVVLGPADDGGFYLIGARRPLAGALAEVPWSTPETLAVAEARLRAAGLRVARIAPWFDVDDEAALARLHGAIRGGEVAAPQTARLLARPISIVMPVLDEAARIERAVDRAAGVAGVREVIVVDGGSRDGTAALAARAPGVTVVASAPGRGRQMNGGARLAVGEVLLFLHADVELPADAALHVEAALADPRTIAGAFRTWTVPDRPTPLGPLLHLADLRSRYTRLPYGDQALFVRSRIFDELGGFAEVPLFEDLELARRLRRRGLIARARASVRVSGRRFLARPVYYTALVNVLPALYRLGIPMKALARAYGAVR
jgi:uncharacterized protein